MKFSLNLAQEYSNVDFISMQHDEILRRIGLQLGAVEDAVDWTKRYAGAVIVRVVSCEKHPDADKLSLCRIDDGGTNQQVERGDDGLIQVVCGAPNVRADMFAAWLAPGVSVPSSRDGDPFVLEAREIRGKVSNGMLGSPSELNLYDNHDGILDIDPEEVGREPSLGEPLADYYGLNDFVVDCENKMFTHRPDCFGNLGIARELAGISGIKFEDPEWYWKKQEFESKQDYAIEVKNEAPDLVSRFMVVVMKNITVKPSPVRMQALLTRVGIKPINNVVDVSNFVMHLTGQPTHAFDYDKLQQHSDNPTLYPRMSQKGEKLKLLGDKEVELTGEEIVIATDKQAVALAGVMGGADTEVDENTKTIVIECATFDMYSIRRTSMRFGLFTDAVTRYNKGQSPLQNDRVLAYLMTQMHESAGAEQASEVYDIKQGYEQAHLDQSMHGFMKVHKDFINTRLGTNLSNEELCTLLQNVHFAAYEENGQLEITPPFWRMDIEIAEDIVEEIGRLYGYDRLPVELPARTIKPTPKNQLRTTKDRLRRMLEETGANEVLTYSFVHGELLKKTGIDAGKWCYHLRNALSPDLQYYRPSLIPSLLAKVHGNIKAGAGSTENQFALFELGKAHVKGHEEDGLPKEMRRLSFVIAADTKTVEANQANAAYYVAKAYLDYITNGRAVYKPLEDNQYPITAPYANGRSAVVEIEGQILGVIGEFSSTVRTSLKLPDFCAGFEIDVDMLQDHLTQKTYQPLPKFPVSQQDITVEYPTEASYQQAINETMQAIAERARDHGYEFVIEPVNMYRPEKQESIHYTFRITVWHPDKTLATEEVSKLLSNVRHE